MSFGKLTLIAILSYAGAATAFPRLNRADVAKEPCLAQKAVVETNTNDISALHDQLRHLAAVSQKDTSVPLKKFKPKKLPPITPEEQHVLNKAIGRCSCKVQINGQPFENENDCTVAGSSGTNSIVMGVAHLINDALGQDGSVPSSLKCEFANNFGDRPVPLVFEKGAFKVGTMNPDDNANDRIVVRLKNPIPGVKEIPVLVSGLDITAGSAIYAISAGLQTRLNTRDLVAQECDVLDSAPSEFATNCTSITGRTSGMPNLARDGQGRIVLVGVTSRSSSSKKDGQPAILTLADGSIKGNNITHSAGIGREAVRDLLSVEGEISRKMVQASDGLPSATTGL